MEAIPDSTTLPRTRGPLVALLESRGLRLRKRDGQNFLVEPAVADAIVAAAAVSRRDHVVEIGPGAGALLVPLLGAAGRVTAVELDRGLADLLRDLLTGDPRLDLVHGDALDGPEDPGGLHPSIDAALRSPAAGMQRTVVVANLPYSCGTEILVRLLLHDAPPAALTVMLQREVIARITATPGSDHYGPLAVLATLAARTSIVRRVPPSAFFPRPDVESVVVSLVPHEHRPPPAQLRAVSALARTAFGRRRKTIANSLGGAVPAGALAAAGIDPGCRAETLPPDAFVRLHAAAAECSGT